MTRARRLGLTASTLPFVVFALSGAAIAQTKPAPAAEEAAPTDAEIVVTGSSLKGVAPVGSNLVTVDRGDIENLGANTVQQVLKSVPAIVGLNSPGQGVISGVDRVDPQPWCLGVQQHADPAQRPPPPRWRCQPCARRPEHRAADDA